MRQLFALFEPAFLCGFTLPDWIRLLRMNQWQVDAKYLPRALIATVGTAFTSFFKTFEDRIDLTSLQKEKWRQPVFILGLPRSGTTHLFNLLSRDPQFCYPTRFDCYNPYTFLTL
ncbi:MAG: sulfotransferase, partial [Chthoniobacterales bacterium]